MGVDAGTPPGLVDRIRQIAAEEVRKFARSGFLRNASISDGGLTIRGGFLRMLFGDVQLFYIGPVSPNLADGSPQQGWIVRRADGSTVLSMRDAFPEDDGGVLRQALNWYDRTGNSTFADDTNSGQGLARPYLPGTFYRSDYADWVAVSGGTFVTKFRARMTKQQPQLYVRAWASNDTSGATGEVRILVNGTQWGPTRATAFSISEFEWGPLTVAGDHMSTLVVEMQARVASGAGAVRLEPSRLEGRQS
jgi:hypothetical protein